MAKRRKLDEALDAVADLASETDPAARRAGLEAALGHRSNLVVAAAARLVNELDHSELLRPLAAHFDRFATDGASADPACRAKIAMLKALVARDEPAAALYESAAILVQKEPVYGGSTDTAVEVRALAVMGLVQMSHPDAVLFAAQLLADPEAPARRGAVEALACSGRPEAIPLLRYKALVGDADLDVVAASLAALLELDREGSAPFVTRFLHGKEPALVEAAALALAEARVFDALPALVDAVARQRLASWKRPLFLAIALLRTDEARAQLLTLLDDSEGETAEAVIDAFAVLRQDDDLRSAVLARLEGRSALRTYADRKLDGDGG